MDDAVIKPLLNNLKAPDEDIREQAAEKLWRIWFNQKGSYGLEVLSQSQALLEEGQFLAAEKVLTELLQNQPDFAEAWNRRAVLRYLQNKFQQSLSDCQQTVALNPIHFGAWHGMGLCHAALGDYSAAIRSFRQALEIQPHEIINQRLLLECTARLS